MTTSQFRRAKLVPFDAGGRDPQESRAIPLDFNPETLTLKVSGGEQRDRSRRGRQQVQNVGSSKATLSFECYFDSTRPRDDDANDDAGGEEMLDVRVRTNELGGLEASTMFAHVYSDPHPLMAEQQRWLADYEASFEGGAA